MTNEIPDAPGQNMSILPTTNPRNIDHALKICQLSTVRWHFLHLSQFYPPQFHLQILLLFNFTSSKITPFQEEAVPAASMFMLYI